MLYTCNNYYYVPLQHLVGCLLEYHKCWPQHPGWRVQYTHRHTPAVACIHVQNIVLSFCTHNTHVLYACHRCQRFLMDIRDTVTTPPNTPIPHLHVLWVIKPEYVTLVSLIINGWLHPQASCLALVDNQSTIERFHSDLLVVLKVARPFTRIIGKL